MSWWLMGIVGTVVFVVCGILWAVLLNRSEGDWS